MVLTGDAHSIELFFNWYISWSFYRNIHELQSIILIFNWISFYIELNLKVRRKCTKLVFYWNSFNWKLFSIENVNTKCSWKLSQLGYSEKTNLMSLKDSTLSIENYCWLCISIEIEISIEMQEEMSIPKCRKWLSLHNRLLLKIDSRFNWVWATLLIQLKFVQLKNVPFQLIININFNWKMSFFNWKNNWKSIKTVLNFN